MQTIQYEEVLLRVSPPRSGERSLLSFENVLESLGEGHIFSLEIMNMNGETSLLVRTIYPERVVQQLESHYPGCSVEQLDASQDPLKMREGRSGWRHILKPDGDEWLPFQVYDERNELAMADPFLDVMSSMRQDLHGGEQVVTRVVLQQQPHDWSEAWRAKALSGAGSENQGLIDKERREQQDKDRKEMEKGRVTQQSHTVTQGNANPNSMIAGHEVMYFIVIAAIVAIVGKFALDWWNDGRIIEVIVYGVVGLGCVLILGFLAWRFGLFEKKEVVSFHEPEQVAVRISGSAFRVEVQTLALLEDSDGSVRLRAVRLLEGVVSAYRGFDNPLGCRFAVEGLKRLRAGAVQSKDEDGVGERLLVFSDDERNGGKRKKSDAAGIVGVREAAAFWHLPGESAEIHSLERSQSKRLSPSIAATGSGCLVGEAWEADGGRRLVFLPPEVTGSHFFLIARTRMGKSTMMAHFAGDRMMEKAEGRNDDALVVVDPHSDLIHDILERVPAELVDRVVVLDLGSQERAIGINLLDTRVFTNRDMAAEAIVEVAKGIWENWGGRMENILSNVMKSLYEANLTLGRRKQLTMLDGLYMLTDDNFRYAVLNRVSDPNLIDWWRSSHGGWAEEYGRQAVAPVITRLTNFSSSTVARSILGQRRCTINLKEIIEAGDVLLVNTNQSAVGAEVSALVGASVVKLVETIVSQQGKIVETDTVKRRKVCLIVDELQTLKGVNFQRMLSELGKFGGVMVMATQSLSRLDELGLTMRDSILANIAGLAVFQVNAVDAERLLPELRSPYLEEADVTGLPVHQCYMRMRSDGKVQAPFTMEVLPPFAGDDLALKAIMEGTYGYSRDTDQVITESNADVEERVKTFRQDIAKRAGSGERDEADSDKQEPDKGRGAEPLS